jgi:hypothetical protein
MRPAWSSSHTPPVTAWSADAAMSTTTLQTAGTVDAPENAAVTRCKLAVRSARRSAAKREARSAAISSTRNAVCAICPAITSARRRSRSLKVRGPRLYTMNLPSRRPCCVSGTNASAPICSRASSSR